MADSTVRQVEVPSAARTLSPLSHVDYEDAFLVDIGPVQALTAEQWARAVLDGTPAIMRSALLRGRLSLVHFGPL